MNPFFITRRLIYYSISGIAQNLKGNQLLDVGCGTKPYQNLFQFEKYIGIDFDKGGANQNPHADFLYDGKKFPFDENEMDCVLATEVFEHVFEPERFLSEVSRVLKPGGKLLITVPFAWPEHEQPFDYSRYTSFGLKYILEKNGFQIILQRKTGNFVLAIGQLINEYFYEVFIQYRPVYQISRITIFPFLTLSTLFINFLLPKRSEYYLDNVILCQKADR